MATVGRGESSLPAVFRRQVEARPEQPAVVDGPRVLSYRELDHAANGIANALAAAGVGRGDLVGLVITRTADDPVLLLGILKACAGYVPLDPDLPEPRLRQIIDDASLTVVAGPPERLGRRLLDGVRVVAKATPALEGPALEPRPDDAAYVIFTSGSTGRPKGCVVEHRNVVALLEGALDLFEFRPGDRWSLFHSFAFDFAVWELWGAFATGGTGVVVPAAEVRDPDRMLAFLARERITVLHQVPSVLRYLALAYEDDPVLLPALRYLILGGEAVDLAVVREFLSGLGATGHAVPRVVNMYGITETTVHATYQLLDDTTLSGPARSPIGKALPHLRIELRDDQGAPVPAGTPGEIWVAGAGVARGYLGRPDLTAERFPRTPGEAMTRWYRSGDLARTGADGRLDYLGRLDHQVKINGVRVELGEIEAVLRAHPGVRDAGVVLVTAGIGAQALVAVVAGEELLDGALREHVASVLPAAMRPARYVRCPALPSTASGKIDRRALAGLAEHELSREGS